MTLQLNCSSPIICQQQTLILQVIQSHLVNISLLSQKNCPNCCFTLVINLISQDSSGTMPSYCDLTNRYRSATGTIVQLSQWAFQQYVFVFDDIPDIYPQEQIIYFHRSSENRKYTCKSVFEGHLVMMRFNFFLLLF